MTVPKTFGTVISDPPWPYASSGPVGTGGRGKTDNMHEITQVGDTGYPFMSLKDICALPVSKHISEQSHLYLWTTNSFMREAYDVIEAWGLVPKTIITWCKTKRNPTDFDEPSMSVGHYYRSATEHCIFATHGKMHKPTIALPTWFYHPRLPHSVKPPTIHEWAEANSPTLRLEMFARRPRPGWESWGNQISSTPNFTPVENLIPITEPEYF